MAQSVSRVAIPFLIGFVRDETVGFLSINHFFNTSNLFENKFLTSFNKLKDFKVSNYSAIFNLSGFLKSFDVKNFT